MSELPYFQLHPMCKQLKLTHLIFANNLMIFCKGNLASMTRVVEALNYFSEASRLISNQDKSNIFIAWVDDLTKKQLLAKSGFTQGSFPIRYLGLPLSSKKWNKLDCCQLVDKITSRIKTGFSKQLSYAGRLQVINSVLFPIYNFWSSVFILPHAVVKEVASICRDYLWGSTEDRRNQALVA